MGQSCGQDQASGRVSRLFALLAIAAVTLLAGCGEDEKTASPPPPTQAPPEATTADPAYAARANSICARALAQTRQLGREFRNAKNPGEGPLDATTELLIKPGIAIREQMADRLRALPPPTEGADLVAVYVELFDPLETLSYERLRAGRAGDAEEAARFELLMLELAEEQMAAARLAGLDTCAANFVNAALG